MSAADTIQLSHELARWRIGGGRARFWLRDDDLVKITPRTDEMSEILRRFKVRALLSIIPKAMDSGLATVLQDQPCYVPCQHGWSHLNHEPAGKPKAEFGAARKIEEAVNEVSEGFRLMRETFGAGFAPVFVPPWNRLSPELCDMLPNLGFVGASGYALADKITSTQRLKVVNADIDILQWDKPEGNGVAAISLSTLVNRIASLLRSQRVKGCLLSSNTIGILTHHRAMNSNAWNDVAAIISITLDSGVADWLDPNEIFGLQI